LRGGRGNRSGGRAPIHDRPRIYGERMAQNFMSVAGRFVPKTEILAGLRIAQLPLTSWLKPPVFACSSRATSLGCFQSSEICRQNTLTRNPLPCGVEGPAITTAAFRRIVRRMGPLSRKERPAQIHPGMGWRMPVSQPFRIGLRCRNPYGEEYTNVSCCFSGIGVFPRRRGKDTLT
jgi:hypothetical protein